MYSLVAAAPASLLINTRRVRLACSLITLYKSSNLSWKNIYLRRHHCEGPYHIKNLTNADLRSEGSASPASTNNPYSSPLVCANSTHRNKEVIQLTEPVYEYLLAHTREPEILAKLREETSTMTGREMQVSPEQGQFLAMLVQLMGAKRCIEVGVFTGYSALSVALALPPGGQLVALERTEHTLVVARRYFQLAGVQDLVDIRKGLALDSLEALLANGEANSYDFAFLDADKRSYGAYYELLLQLLRPGGVVVVDNVLWYGRVADPQVSDKKTQYLRSFNTFLLNDTRVSTSMVPIGDGLTICRKREDEECKNMSNTSSLV